MNYIKLILDCRVARCGIKVMEGDRHFCFSHRLKWRDYCRRQGQSIDNPSTWWDDETTQAHFEVFCESNALVNENG